MARKVRVRSGDCISSIAFQHGLFPDTVWEHEENEDLRELRGDATVLQEGDVVHVPDVTRKSVSIPTNARHVFRRRGVPERLRLHLVEADGRPRAGVPYTLRIDKYMVKEGSTDADGWVIEFIQPDALRGVLELPEGESYELSLGHLDPVSSVRGLQQRLHNLGYRCEGDPAGALGPATWDAIRRFMDEAGETLLGEDEDSLPRVRELVCERHGV